MSRGLFLMLWMIATAACSSPVAPLSAPGFPSGMLVDLSHAYDEQTIFWPTADRFRLEKVTAGITDRGYYYAANNFFGAEHGGTHLDAPIHFAAGRRTVDQIPLEQLTGEAVVVDVTAQCDKSADYQVAVGDFQQWEWDHGPIPSGAVVLIRTGFARHWPDASRYLGTAERGEGAISKLHFPGLDPDAARWLVTNRSIDALGIDTASIDYGQSSLFESHRILYERDIPAFENLANLELLPATGAFVIALPMKIAGGTGAPLRAIAIVPPPK